MREKRSYDGHNRKPGKKAKLARHRFSRRYQRRGQRERMVFVQGQHSEGGYYRLN